MRKIHLFPVLFFLAGVFPFAFFLWNSPKVLERHFQTIVSNDPQNSLSQSLAALTNTQMRFQSEINLKAMRIASLEPLRKALGKAKPKFEDIKSALGDALEPPNKTQLVLSDAKGNALFNNLGMALPLPPPTLLPDKKRKSTHSPRPAEPAYPSILDWPGMDKALQGFPIQGAFQRNGQAYWGIYFPLTQAKQNLKVLVLAFPLDNAWLKQLSRETLNDLIFYSQAQTMVTCQCTAPALNPAKLVAPSSHPEKRLQVDWDDQSYLVDGIEIPGIDGKSFGTIALFQPVRKTVTVLGDPRSDLLRLGLICLALMAVFLLAVGWGYTYSMKQALVSIAGIKYGSSNTGLPVNRIDEWGRMARSLQEMRDRFKEKERVSLILGKYMAPDVAKKLLVEKNFFALEGETRGCVLMAVVLRQLESLEFTTPPKVWLETLNEYFTLIHESVARHEGLMDYFLGNQAHAAWGVPFALEDMVGKACSCATEIMEHLTSLNIEKISRNEPRIELSIGLHYGPVVAGNIGSDRFYGYSVIGRSVEIAQELAKHADSRQILASSDFSRKVHDPFSTSPLPSFKSGELGELAPFQITAASPKT